MNDYFDPNDGHFDSALNSMLPFHDGLLGVGNEATSDGLFHHSPFDSGFDAEHPMPSFEQLRNAGFSDYIAHSILDGGTHSYSEKELFQCLYGSDDPVKAYNEMMEAKVNLALDKSESIINDIEKELGL